MPSISACTTQQEIRAAYQGYLATLDARREQLGLSYSGYEQMAKDFYNGVEGILFNAIRRKQRWYRMTEDAEGAGPVTGLLRIELHDSSVHISQVTAVGGGKLLVEKAKEVARTEGKETVDLSTADEGLPGYYARLGFAMVTPGAKTGEMMCNLPSWDARQ